MDKFFFEALPNLFSNGHMRATGGDFAAIEQSRVQLHRDSDFNLILELTKPGISSDDGVSFPAGTVRVATEAIHFSHFDGSTGTASGVTPHGSHSTWDGRLEETKRTFSVHSADLRSPENAVARYTVDWISNIPSDYFNSVNVSTDQVTSFTRTIGSGAEQIDMRSGSKTSHGERALHVRFDNVNAYVLRSHEKSSTQDGSIVYDCVLDEDTRKRFRCCLSFALGRLLVYRGFTLYSEHWPALYMKSYDAFTLSGAAFRLVDQPPFPISEHNVRRQISDRQVSLIVGALLATFDDLNFDEIAWSYWYAMSAPMHTSAVHYGALIEVILNFHAKATDADLGALLPEGDWKKLRERIYAALEDIKLDDSLLGIIKGKISSLNRAPPTTLLKRVCQKLGLDIGDADLSAWKHRNIAAHGGSAKPFDLIDNSKLLRLVMLRLIAATTRCSEFYIDYYSLAHPIRPCREAVPKRC